MNKKVLSLIVLIGCAAFTEAAPKSLLGRFLSVASNDSVVVSQQGHIDILKNTRSSMPLIGDAEIRVRNRAFDFGGQRYTLKLEPRGVGETKALRSYKRAQLDYEETLHRYTLNELLLLRYVFFIDMLERKSLADGYGDLIPVYEDRIKVLEQLQNSTDFNLSDLIKEEKNLAKMISEKIEESQEVATANRYIWSIVGDSLNGGIDTAGLISVAEIKKEFEKAVYTLDEDNIYLKNIREEFRFTEKRYEVERAQNRKLISFFEFSFDFGSYNDEIMQEHRNKSSDRNKAVIMEVGVKLPFISGDREDVARRQIDFLNDREDCMKLREELASKMKKDIADMKAYIERYDMLTARETESDAEASLKKYTQMSGVDPLALLEIREALVKNRMEKEKMYFSILRNYIYIKDVTGDLIKEPLINYLSAQRETLEK